MATPISTSIPPGMMTVIPLATWNFDGKEMTMEEITVFHHHQNSVHHTPTPILVGVVTTLLSYTFGNMTTTSSAPAGVPWNLGPKGPLLDGTAMAMSTPYVAVYYVRILRPSNNHFLLTEQTTSQQAKLNDYKMQAVLIDEDFSDDHKFDTWVEFTMDLKKCHKEGWEINNSDPLHHGRFFFEAIDLVQNATVSNVLHVDMR